VAPAAFTEAHARAKQATRKGRPQQRSLKPAAGHHPAAGHPVPPGQPQATCKGWPYYIRLSSQHTIIQPAYTAGRKNVSRPPARGWPYYIQCGHAACGWIVYSRATPLGVNLTPPQATRHGWPYYIWASDGMGEGGGGRIE